MAYTYTGDVNIEHGGMFLDFDEFKEMGDYIPAVEITDLDSAIGFAGAIMIERGSIYIPEDQDKRKAALACIGQGDNLNPTSEMLVQAFSAYWGIERDSYTGVITIQTEKNGKLEFDGWKVDKEELEKFWNSGLSLREFIESEYVS